MAQGQSTYYHPFAELIIFNSMKKLFLQFVLLASFVLQIQAQGFLPGGFKHIIEVGRYSDYGKGYLTITDDCRIYIKDDENSSKQPFICTYEYVDEYKNDSSKFFYYGDLILEVDGKSANGWSAEEFYKKVEGRRDVITFKIRGWRDTIICDFNTKIRPLYELPDNLKMFGYLLSYEKNYPNRIDRYRLKYDSWEERQDEDFDFFYARNFDFLITSNDPLLDKEIFKETSMWWARHFLGNVKNPDILFTIARDAKESIESTYIPPTSRTINTGSTTTAVYNYYTKKNDYITVQNNRTIHEGGYTQETKTIDMFLEICALDVKRLNDTNTTHPPIVWQTTVKRHVVNPSSTFNTSEELKAYASCMYIPIHDRFVYVQGPVYAPLGVINSAQNPQIITEVEKGSRAEKLGLMPGDKLIKAYEGKKAVKSLKKKGWDALYYQYNYTIEILRNDKKLKIDLQPISIDVTRVYYD